LTKDKIVEALNAIQNSRGAGQYHDELETAIALLVNANDGEVAAAWDEIQSDPQ